MSGEENDQSSILDSLKFVGWVVGVLILFNGLIYLEEYYAALGLRYYVLGMPIQDITYKGAKLILESWVVGLVFVCLPLVPTLSEYKYVQSAITGIANRRLVAIILCFVALLLDYYAVKHLAIQQANANTLVESSELRALREFRSEDKDKETMVMRWKAEHGTRLRIISATESQLFLIVLTPRYVIPNIKVVGLTRGDVYETSGRGP